MNILVLTNDYVLASPLSDWLRACGEEVEVLSEINASDVMDIMDDSIINLHPSFLPWNRGADACLWSLIDNTPKGATIHKVTGCGVNTGDILRQENLELDGQKTLKYALDKANQALVDMFKSNWKYLREKRVCPSAQAGEGSFHTEQSLDKYRHILKTYGYDITIADFRKLCEKNR